MIEKENRVDSENRGRFAFLLTINDFIVCRRDFFIPNFNEISVKSIDLLNAFRECVRMIKSDLNAKSRLYLWHTAPFVFDNEGELKKFMDNTKKKTLNVDTFFVCRDTESVFAYNSEEHTYEPFNGYFNMSDYTEKFDDIEKDSPCAIKFSFLDRGREVLSEIWSGNDYPKFVRSNIDLSSSKNRYGTEEKFSPYEWTMVNIFNNSQTDLIPVIIGNLCYACSKGDDEYVSVASEYGYKKNKR